MSITCQTCDHTLFADELTAYAAGWRLDDRHNWTCGVCLAEASAESGRLELVPSGYAELEKRLGDIERLVNAGIVNPERALECCRKIRVELYGMLQTLRGVCVIVPGGEAA